MIDANVANSGIDWTNFIPAVIGAIAPIITGVVGFFVSRYQSRKDREQEEKDGIIRQQQDLADQQQEFQKQMQAEMRLLRESILIEQQRNQMLERTVKEWEFKYTTLDQEWKLKYQSLENENKDLLKRVQELEDELRIFKSNK